MLLDIVEFILGGTVVTLAVTGVALPMGFALGLLFSLARVYGGRLLSRFAALYSVVMRGVPPIVLLFILYFIIAGTINLSPFWAGSLSLGIISSAYQLEVFRGAVLSVGTGQMMAARAIGMSRLKAIRYIVLPQALRVAIPPWSNEAATVLKDSSLVSILAVADLLRRGREFASKTFYYFETYTVVALVYLVITLFFSKLVSLMEERLNRRE